MSGNNGSLVAPIDTTKPAGPIADCADVRANFAASLANLQDHETRIEALEAGGGLSGPLTTPLQFETGGPVIVNSPISGGPVQWTLNMGLTDTANLVHASLTWWNVPTQQVITLFDSYYDPTAAMLITQLSGVITLSQDPVNNLDAATKQYVDAAVAPLLSRIAALEGGST